MPSSQSNARSLPRVMKFVFGCADSGLRKREQSIGVSVREMTPETRIAALSVTANS